MIVLKFAPLCVEVERAFGMAKMDELSEEGKQVAKKALEAIVRKRGEFATACTMGDVCYKLVRQHYTQYRAHVHPCKVKSIELFYSTQWIISIEILVYM